MPACPSCGAQMTGNGICPNWECSSRTVTPPAFEAADTIAPMAPPQTAAERIAELEAALRRYGAHHPTCRAASPPTTMSAAVRWMPCSCGLGKVLEYREVR